MADSPAVAFGCAVHARKEGAVPAPGIKRRRLHRKPLTGTFLRRIVSLGSPPGCHQSAPADVNTWGYCLQVMATSKSTVVGIRLDHERRAWVEAEAARLGVSVRGLFEGMIDEARSGDSAEAGRVIAGLGSAAPSATTPPAPDDGPDDPGGDRTSVRGQSDPFQAGSTRSSSSSPWSGVGVVTALPTSLLRETFSLTASLIELSGRCAAKRLESCVLTRHFGRRSL